MNRTCACWCFALLLSGIAAPQNTQSTSREPAVYVSAVEVSRAVETVPASGTKDAVLRIVPVAGEYNVGVSVVRRVRVDGSTAPDALLHHSITEVYQVTSGCGVLVTGGTLIDGKELRVEDPDVRSQIGPTMVGTMIRGGKAQKIGPGDVVVIPKETPHGFTEICTEGITYSLVRVDNRRVLRASGAERKAHRIR